MKRTWPVNSWQFSEYFWGVLGQVHEYRIHIQRATYGLSPLSCKKLVMSISTGFPWRLGVVVLAGEGL